MEAMIDKAQNHGVRMIYWPEKMLGQFKKAWEEVADEQAAKDAFLKRYGRIWGHSGPNIISKKRMDSCRDLNHP